MRMIILFTAVSMFISSAPAFAMGSIVDRHGDWVAVEHDDQGKMSCSISWEPEKFPLRYQLHFDGSRYRQTISGLSRNAYPGGIIVEIEGHDYAAKDRFTWDGDLGGFVSFVSPAQAHTILNLPSNEMYASLWFKAQGRQIMKFSMDDIDSVTTAMERCSDALTESMSDDETQDQIQEAQLEQRLRAENPAPAYEQGPDGDPIAFIQQFQKQTAQLPDQRKGQRMLLGMGYALYIQADQCNKRGISVTGDDLKDVTATVRNLIDTERVPKDEADLVWEVANLSLQIDNSAFRTSDCPKTMQALGLVLPKYLKRSVASPANPFTR